MTDTLYTQGLTEQRDQLAKQVAVLEVQERTLTNQLVKIAEMVLAEADARDFCEDYERFVDKVNEAIGATILLHRKRAFTVEFTGTMEVKAASRTAAADECRQALWGAVNNCDWEMGFSVEGVEECE